MAKKPLPTAEPKDRARAMRVYRALEKAWPEATCELIASAPHELLIATILSAQSTDIAVNAATPALFKAFTIPLGLYRNKSKAVVESMRRVVDEYGGEVPATMEELLTLRGVARKTANVVLGNAFDINEGVVVDTHVMRLAWRLGLTDHEGNVAKIERDLMARFPKNKWTMLSHLLIFHGRYACKARNRACGEHPVCKSYGASERCSCAT
jgi:endonuclease-3